MKKLNKIIILFMILFLGCEQLEIEEADSNVAVIESYIQPGNTITVKVSKQLEFNSDDTIYPSIDDLNVNIFLKNEWLSLSYVGEGIYEDTSLTFEAGEEIELEFEYNHQLISSSTIIPEKPEEFVASAYLLEAFVFSPESMTEMPEPPEPITLSWSNSGNDYHMVVVENIEANPALINDDFEDRPQLSFRNSPVQGSSQELNSRVFSYYGDHRIILFRLNAEYAALYEQLGTSSLDITAPPSNIENGLGIFTGINSDTIIINVY